MRVRIGAWWMAAAASLALVGCDDAGEAAAPRDGTADAGVQQDAGADAAPDAAAPGDATADAALEDTAPAPTGPIQAGDWLLGVEFAELGGLSLSFVVTFDDVTDAAIGVVTLFATDGDTVSEPLTTLEDVAFDSDAITLDFGLVTLPAEYSPVNVEVGVVAEFIGTVQSPTFLCGDVRGLVPAFAIAIESSTFGAIPLAESEGVALPTSCDWTPTPFEEREVVTIGPEDRPAQLELPRGVEDTSEPLPVVMVLHGFEATGNVQADYFGLRALQDELGYLLVVPEGTVNSDGAQFWNAIPACCDFENTGVDDVAYLEALITEVVTTHGGDPDDVTLVGHSNGGFMALRMACESTAVTGVVNLAGSSTPDTETCTPAGPVSILNVHGSADPTIPYGGRPGATGYPGAVETTEQWAARNACGEAATDAPRDYVANLDGDETTIVRYPDCDGSAVVGLWTVEGGGHIPPFRTPDFGRDALLFLHARDTE